jgi:hypothetical protein
MLDRTIDRNLARVENAGVDQVGLIAIMGVAAGVIYVASRDGARATQTAFEGYFRGFRSDPWPHGVQEQDLGQHWDAAGRTSRGGAGSRSGAGSRAKDGSPEDGDEYVWVEEDLAEVRTLMRPPAIRIEPIRSYRLESHI